MLFNSLIGQSLSHVAVDASSLFPTMLKSSESFSAPFEHFKNIGVGEHRPNQPITPPDDCSASKCLISFSFEAIFACVRGRNGAVYRV